MAGIMPNMSLERSLQEETRERIPRMCLRVRANIHLFSQHLFECLRFAIHSASEAQSSNGSPGLTHQEAVDQLIHDSVLCGA